MRQEDFEWVYSDEPHATRRKAILSKYPEVRKLFGHDPLVAAQCISVCLSQFFVAYWVCNLKNLSPIAFTVICYIIGGTLNHNLTLGMHEISHNLAFKGRLANKMLGLFVNLPLGIPSFATFRVYHQMHHKYMTVDHVDPDLPTDWEGMFFTTPLRKLFWVLFQPLFYALRPLLVVKQRPPKKSLLLVASADRWIMLNVLTQLTFNALVYSCMDNGGKMLWYFVLGTFLGLGLHPMAGHFYAEHFLLFPATKNINGSEYQGVASTYCNWTLNETYSYYG